MEINDNHIQFNFIGDIPDTSELNGMLVQFVVVVDYSISHRNLSVGPNH